MATLRSRRSVPITGIPKRTTLVSRRSQQVSGVPQVVKGLTSRRSDERQAEPDSLSQLPFRIRRGYEGLQIVINWEIPPVGAEEIALVRKWGSWAQSIEEGVILITDELPFSIFSYSDQQLDAYEVYYYSLFARRVADSAWVTDLHYRGKIFPLPTGYFRDRCWRSLPQVYHREDGE